MRVIYLDVLIVLNFVMDYCILRAAAGLGGKKNKGWRMAAGAGLGACYAAWSVLQPSAACAPMRLLCGGVITQTAFAERSIRAWVRSFLLVMLVTFVFGGCVLALGAMTGADFYEGGALYAPIPRRVLFAAAALSYGLSCAVFRRKAAEHAPQGECVRITVCGKQQELHLLCDTGNTLRDPITGRAVVILSRKAALRLLPEQLHALVLRLQPDNAAELICRFHGQDGMAFRLISFHSIGGGGLMPCFHPDAIVRQDGTAYDAMAAITCTQICSGDYDGLIAAD